MATPSWGRVEIMKTQTIRQKSILRQEEQFACCLIAPVVIYLLAVMLIPFLWAIYSSFTDIKVDVNAAKFTGIDNYISLLKMPLFYKAISNTLIFSFFAVLLKVIFGLSMALLLNEKLRGRNLLRSILVLPWTMPTLITVLTWSWIFSDVGGAFNFILMKSGLIEYPIGWFQNNVYAMCSIILVNVWRGIPFIGISTLAGLQTIDSTMYEAATVDGAGVFQRFFYITLPSIRNVIALSAMITTIWTLNDFELIWLLTHGGPGNATQVISTLTYTLAFQNHDIGKAIAVSVFPLLFVIPITRFIAKQTLTSD